MAEGQRIVIKRAEEVALLLPLSVEQLCAAVDQCKEEEHLTDLCQAFTMKQGYDYFLGAFQYPKHFNFVLTRYPPEWYARYTREKYILIDPVVARIHTAFSGYSWSDLPMTEQSLAMFDDARRHGIFGGISIPARGPESSVMLMNLASGSPQQLTGPNAAEVFARSQLFAQKVLAAGERVAAMRRSRYAVSKEEEVTPRQMKALTLMSMGKTAKEIAKQMGIGTSRVNQLFDGLQKKFGVETREELLVRASMLGYIRWAYVPENLMTFEQAAQG